MYHPSFIDSTDLPAIENFFAWCAAERDAGRLEILTTSGLMMANHQSTARHNMLSARTSFQSGWNGWNGAPAEWALQTESGTRHARRGSKSTPLIKDIPVGAYVGSTRQLRINMRSSGGVRVTFEVMDASSTTRLNIIRDVTLAPSAVFGPTHQYLTVPLTGTSQLRIRITPRSGGDLHVREPELLAA